MVGDLKKKIDEAREIVEKLGLREPHKSGVFCAVLTQLLLREKVEGELEKPKLTKKVKIAKKKVKYRKNSPAFYLSRLLDETDFFKERIKTTAEIVEGIWIKFRKRVRHDHASRDFFLVVKNEELSNDFVHPCRKFPKGTYIWFLSDIPKQEIERYKKKISGK